MLLRNTKIQLDLFLLLLYSFLPVFFFFFFFFFFLCPTIFESPHGKNKMLSFLPNKANTFPLYYQYFQFVNSEFGTIIFCSNVDVASMCYVSMWDMKSVVHNMFKLDTYSERTNYDYVQYTFVQLSINRFYTRNLVRKFGDFFLLFFCYLPDHYKPSF